VKDFFNIPLGKICRIEKTINPVPDFAKQGKYTQMKDVNFVEVYTKDGRWLKI